MKEKELFLKLNEIAEKLNYDIYVVGGYVRDKLLGIACKDLDFVITGDAMKFSELLKKTFKLRQIVQYPRFGTFMAKYKEFNLEFVNARTESYDLSSRKPVTKHADLETDLARRDFTINTLAMNISPEKYGKIIDIFNGQNDLQNKIIRTPLEPGQTFSDDPLRMMRAIRFAARFDLEIDNTTFEGIKENVKRISIISQERIQDELNKILQADIPSRGIRLLDECGLLTEILPETVLLKGVEQRKDFHHKDVFYHTLEVLDNIAKTSTKLELRLAALLHDIAKPNTKRFIEGTGWTFHGHEVVGERMSGAILKRLKYSNEQITFVKKLVRLHLRPMALVSDEVSDSAMRRLLFVAGEEFDALMKLCRADITSKNPKRVKRYLKNYEYLLTKIAEVEERDRMRNFQPPLDGHEIMEIFNSKPGPLIGKVKKFILEAILDGDVENEHDACLRLVLNNKQLFTAD